MGATEWLLLVVAMVALSAVALAMRRAQRRGRAAAEHQRRLREEVAAALVRRLPGWGISAAGADRLRLEPPATGDAVGAREISLERVGAAMAVEQAAALVRGAAGGAEVAAGDDACQRVVDRFAAFAEEGFTPFDEPLQPKAHGARVLPRLVRREQLVALGVDAEAPPHTALGDTGLAAVYVVEEAGLLRYLIADSVAELNLDPAALHDLSLAVLRQRFDGEVVRRALAEGRPIPLPAQDAFTASRLLLLPEHLAAGEEVAAWVPDPGSLIIAPVALARAQDPPEVPGVTRSSRLLERPLRVTGASVSFLERRA